MGGMTIIILLIWLYIQQSTCTTSNGESSKIYIDGVLLPPINQCINCEILLLTKPNSSYLLLALITTLYAVLFLSLITVWYYTYPKRKSYLYNIKGGPIFVWSKHFSQRWTRLEACMLCHLYLNLFNKQSQKVIMQLQKLDCYLFSF